MVNNRIAIIGDRDTVIGFRMVGVQDAIISTTPEETRRAVLSLARSPETGLILITESLAQDVEDLILELSQSPVPVILLIPDRRGKVGTHENVLRELIRKAVGVEANI